MFKTFRVGIGFGLTSAIITTLGVIVGLGFGLDSKLVIISAILTIAIADSLSDALGVHIAKEAEGNFTHREIWRVTIFTFIFKFIFSLTFLPFIIFLSLPLAIYLSVVWGLLMLSIFSYKLAKFNQERPGKIIFEHLMIAFLVLVLTYLIGIFINNLVQ